MNVVPYIDSDPITARGTPMARPKIGESIVDVIGGTPMVKNLIDLICKKVEKYSLKFLILRLMWCYEINLCPFYIL